MRTITRDIPYLLSLWEVKTCDTFTSFIHFLRSILYIMSDIVRNFIVGLLALVEEINRLLPVRVDFEQLVTNIARLEEAIDRLCCLERFCSVCLEQHSHCAFKFFLQCCLRSLLFISKCSRNKRKTKKMFKFIA